MVTEEPNLLRRLIGELLATEQADLRQRPRFCYLMTSIAREKKVRLHPSSSELKDLERYVFLYLIRY